jgi:hypothetical protein
MCSAAAYGQAGPPLITDDPGTPEKGHWEINLAFTYDKTSRSESIEAPVLDVNYGAMNHVQIKLEVPWQLERSGTHNPSGLGESTAGIKWRFLDEDENGVAVSVYPQLSFHWPELGIARDRRERSKVLILPLELQKTLGPITVGWESGVELRRSEKPTFFHGIALGHSFGERFELLGEVRLETKSDFSRQQWIANGGLRFQVSKSINILSSVGTVFRSPEPDHSKVFSYVALQFSF